MRARAHSHFLEALPSGPRGPERLNLFTNLEPGSDLLFDGSDSIGIGLASTDFDETGQERDDVEVGEGLQEGVKVQ